MNKKEQQSIEFLRSMEREESLSLGFSGGKKSKNSQDSVQRKLFKEKY